MCARTVTLYDRAGVAALHIEDQVDPEITSQYIIVNCF